MERNNLKLEQVESHLRQGQVRIEHIAVNCPLNNLILMESQYCCFVAVRWV